MPEKSTKVSKPSAGKRRREVSSNSPEGVATSSKGTSRRKGGIRAGQPTRKDWQEKNKDRDPITLSLPAVSENIRSLLNALNSDVFAKERETLKEAHDKFVTSVGGLVDSEREIFEEIARREGEKKEKEENPAKNGETVEYLDQCIQAEKTKRSPLRDRYNNAVGKYKSVWQAIEKKLKISISTEAYTDEEIAELAKKIDEGNK